MGILGHSEGGIVAQKIAAKNKNIAFIDIYAAVNADIISLRQYIFVNNINGQAVVLSDKFVCVVDFVQTKQNLIMSDNADMTDKHPCRFVLIHHPDDGDRGRI